MNKNGTERKPLVDRTMQLRVRRDMAVALAPSEILGPNQPNRAAGNPARKGREKSLALVVLRARAIRIHVEHRVIDVDRLGQAHRLFHHPSKRNI